MSTSRKNKISAKLLSLFMSALLVVTLCPMPALALTSDVDTETSDGSKEYISATASYPPIGWRAQLEVLVPGKDYVEGEAIVAIEKGMAQKAIEAVIAAGFQSNRDPYEDVDHVEQVKIFLAIFPDGMSQKEGMEILSSLSADKSNGIKLVELNGVCRSCEDPELSYGLYLKADVDYVSNEIIVGFDSSFDEAQIIEAIGLSEAKVTRLVKSNSNVSLALVETDADTTSDIACGIQQDWGDGIFWVCANSIYAKTSFFGEWGPYETKFERFTSYIEQKSGIDYVENQVIAVFDSSVRKDLIESYIKQTGYSLKKMFLFKGIGYIATLELAGDCSVVDAIASLETATFCVKYAEPNGIAVASEESLNDSTVSRVYDTGSASQWNLAAMNVFDAWSYSRCNGSTCIAVLDTGIDFDHPDLCDNIAADLAWDTINETPLSEDALNSHGTHVAGIAAARVNDWAGVSGVSYNATILPVKVLGDNGQGCWEDTVEGINYIINSVDFDGRIVINMSLSGSDYYYTLEQAVNEAAESGIVCVCAAGNIENEGVDATSATYPSDFDACISVVNTNSANNLSSSSKYGMAKDIAAPGESIYSTVGGGGYAYMTGTSMASPAVAGVVALMLAYNPNLTIDQVKNALYSTATDLGDVGKDMYYGWGLVDASRAIQKVVADYPDGVWRRLSGVSRIDTACAISHEGWSRGDCDTVIVTTGFNFPDALSASALAGVYGCPILLNDSSATNGLSWEVSAEITRLGADKAIVLGGTNAVSAEAFAKLQQILGSTNVSRVCGDTRWDTCEAVYDYGSDSWSNTCIVVQGETSPADALSISSYAYATKSPIFIVDSTGVLPDNLKQAISGGGFDRAVIAGGTGSVSANTESYLGTLFGYSKVLRLGGTTRFETSAAIATWAVGNDVSAKFQPSVELSYNYCAIAEGSNSHYADGLVGGALSGKLGSVLLLADATVDNYGAAVSGNLASNVSSVHRGYLLGGTAALPAAFQLYLRGLIQ